MQNHQEPTEAGWRRERTEGGFESLVGPLYFKPEPDRTRFGFRAETRHRNPGGVIHGGMLMSFADYALGSVVWKGIGKKPCATVSLNCDFVAAARPGDWIEGDAWLTRKGRSLVFVRGVLSVGGSPVLTADGIWKILGSQEE